MIAAAGVWRGLRVVDRCTRRSGGLGFPAVLALVLGWVIFRIVHFPPFAEFLIATEAEMNKVSWTSKDDLYRATTVVLATVLLMASFSSWSTGSGCSSSATSASSSSPAEEGSARPPDPEAPHDLRTHRLCPASRCRTQPRTRWPLIEPSGFLLEPDHD